ncbi:gag-pol polyprotein [Lasius niger]|uniref:Gag-pol polyprotein n=1 Tax=Lasius niger TaxID=67767 RepID=A0A0J7KJI8_LASNI|nr:gag-pol polyprotein [Lasius niger]
MSETLKVPRVVLRKLKSRKKKPKEIVDEPIEGASSVRMSAESDRNSEPENIEDDKQNTSRGDSEVEFTGIHQLDAEAAKRLRLRNTRNTRRTYIESSSSIKDSDPDAGPNKKRSTRKNKKASKLISSSFDEDYSMDFIPDDLRGMGASAAGALGLNYLHSVESERKNSLNINGQVSGRMRSNLKKAMHVINTLVYKAEASGDPVLLKIKNKDNGAQVEKMKLNEVTMKRELDDMRAMMDLMRNEISDLKDRINEAEEDRRKARESMRIMLWKHKKERGEMVCDSPEVLMDELPVKDGAPCLPENPPVNSPPGSYQSKAVEESKPSFFSATIPATSRNKEEVTEKPSSRTKEINNKITNLIRQRVELKRQDMEDSGTGSDRRRAGAKPLSQRTPRIKPKVVENIQLIPPRSIKVSGKKDRAKPEDIGLNGDAHDLKEPAKSEWTEIRKWKDDKVKKNQGRQEGYSSFLKRRNSGNTSVKDTKDRKPKNVVRKAPKTSAVMITGCKEKFSYADALKKARKSISLKKLEIERTKVRRAANGGMLIEVIGPDSARKAIALRNKLSDVLKDEAQVTRPVVREEIRLIGLDASTSVDEVRDVVIGYGGCLKDYIRMGTIRPMMNGLYTVWVQCPLNAALG